jgi:type II secretory pathway component PulL
LDSAAKAGADLLAHRHVPQIELRRGVLAERDKYRSIRGLLRFTQLAATVFLLVTIIVSTIRTYQYSRLTSAYQASQESLYQTVLPGQRSVTGMRSRLESEYKKLSGVAGIGSATPDTVSALETLGKLLRSLPNDLTFNLQELHIEDKGYVYLRGQVPSHGGADALASALRAGEFNVQQPTSTQTSDRIVAISLSATAEPEKGRLERSP